MDSLDDLSKDPNWLALLKKMRKDSLGTLRVVMDKGRLKFRGPVEGQYFDTPAQAAEWIQASGFKKREAIDNIPGRPSRALSPTGSHDYRQLRALSEDIRAVRGYEDVTVVREAYGVHTGAVQAQMEHFVRGGQTYGFAVPDDETTTIFRMYRGKEELTQQEVRDAFHAAGLSFDPRDTKAHVKLMKRLKIVGNPEPMFGVLDAPLRVGVFADDNPLALQMGGVTSSVTSDMAKRNASGMSHMNPRVLMDTAKKMEEVNNLDEVNIANLTDPAEIRLAKKNIKANKAEIARLRKVAKEGGRLQGFRATGLSIDDPLFKSLENSLIKGDVNVAALGGEWAEWVGRASPLLAGTVDPDSLDLITPESNLTKEAGRGNLRANISFKPSHVGGGLNASAQPLAAYGPELYGGANYADVINESTSWLKAQLHHMETTGELPTGYEGQLRKLLDMGSVYNKKADPDIQALMRSFGIVDDASLMNQQARAQRILGMQAMGLNVANHEPLFREVADGMRQSLLGDSKHAGQLSGRVPVAARMHMQGSLSGFIMTGEQVGRGEFSVDPRFGLTYNGEDFVKEHMGGKSLYERHGGGDFDDDLAVMLRYDEANDRLVGVNYRDPMGSGEIAAARPTEQSILNLASMATAEPGQNTALRQSLENVGFYDIHERVAQKRRWYEIQIEGNEWIMLDKNRSMAEVIEAQRSNDILRNVQMPDLDDEIRRTEAAAIDVIKTRTPRLSAVDLDTLSKAHVPVGMELLDTGNYESYVKAQEAKFAHMLSSKDTPDGVAALFGLDHGTHGQFLGMDPYTFRDWENRLVRERGQGVLGNYSLIREMADEYTKQVEDAGQSMVRPLKYLIQEAVIDPLTKGFSDEYTELSPQRIEATGLAMLQDMVETARVTGVKLDPLRLEHRFNPRTKALIPEMINNIDPSAGWDDVVMSSEEAANATFGRSMKAMQQADDHYEYLIRKQAENMDLQRAIKRTAFSQEALEDARAMAETFTRARAAVEAGGVGIPNEVQEMTLGMVGQDTSSDLFKNARAREAVQRTFAGFLEGGSMGDRAMNAMGAFIQQYQGSSAFSAVQEGTLATAQMVARGSFLYNNASSSLGESAFYTAEQVRSARQLMGGASEITEDYLKAGASHITEFPGEKRAKGMAHAYDIASEVASGVMNGKAFARGPGAEGVSFMSRLKGLGEFSAVRKGAVAVGAAVLGSTIYSAVKDRTNHDMEGPPLLPGGSAYEDYYDRPPQSMSQYRPPSSEGGVRYKVNTRGGDHKGFRKSAEQYTGARSTGSTYSSRNYDRDGMSSALNGAF